LEGEARLRSLSGEGIAFMGASPGHFLLPEDYGQMLNTLRMARRAALPPAWREALLGDDSEEGMDTQEHQDAPAHENVPGNEAYMPGVSLKTSITTEVDTYEECLCEKCLWKWWHDHKAIELYDASLALSRALAQEVADRDPEGKPWFDM
jgi:hypothetical protein